MGKVSIELIVDKDCPNVETTRTQLKASLEKLGLPTEWIEWDRSSQDSPKYARQYGSPTILVNKKDIAGVAPTEANCCRVYQTDENPFAKTPAIETIVSAIQAANKPSHISKSTFAAIPAILLSLLPVVSCPACWPAYASLLATFGIGFINYTPYVIPILSALLLISLFGLAYKAKERRGYKPTILGAFGASFVLFAKHYELGSAVLYLGVGLLFTAVAWNVYPRRRNSCTV